MTTAIANEEQTTSRPAADQAEMPPPPCTPPALEQAEKAGKAMDAQQRHHAYLTRRAAELDKEIPRLRRDTTSAEADLKKRGPGSLGSDEEAQQRVQRAKAAVAEAERERESIRQEALDTDELIKQAEATASQLVTACVDDPKAVERQASSLRKELARQEKALAKCRKLQDQFETKVRTAEADFTAAIDTAADEKIEAAQDLLAKHSAARGSVLDQIARREDEIQGTKARLELAEAQVETSATLAAAREQRSAFEDLRKQEAELVANLVDVRDAIEEESRRGEALNRKIGGLYGRLNYPGYQGQADGTPRPAREAGSAKTCRSQTTYNLSVDKRTLAPAGPVAD